MLSRRQFLLTGAAAVGAGTANAQMADAFKLQLVDVKSSFPAGEIHVTPWNHFLYFTQGGGKALRYGVAVGEEGRNFSGEAYVGRKAEWPSWTPTKNMIAREPEKYAQFAAGMPGGPENPLGARALYMYRNGRDTFYRIHGTPQPWTIGYSVSSGCIRLVNPHIEHLYRRVPIGAKVVVHSV